MRLPLGLIGLTRDKLADKAWLSCANMRLDIVVIIFIFTLPQISSKQTHKQENCRFTKLNSLEWWEHGDLNSDILVKSQNR